MTRNAPIVLALVALAGCSARAGTAATVSDAEGPPPGAFAECDAGAQVDAALFAFQASCALPKDDAGAVTECQEWSQTADGDWNPFIDSCGKARGAIATSPCPRAGAVGTCALARTCTTETVVFSYGADGGASAKASCDAIAGATFSQP